MIHEKYPGREVKIANAEGLKECRKLLTVAKSRKIQRISSGRNGMSGGCSRAGTMQSIKKSQTAVNKYAAMAGHTVASQTEYVKRTGKTGVLERVMERWTERRIEKDTVRWQC